MRRIRQWPWGSLFSGAGRHTGSRASTPTRIPLNEYAAVYQRPFRIRRIANRRNGPEPAARNIFAVPDIYTDGGENDGGVRREIRERLTDADVRDAGRQHGKSSMAKGGMSKDSIKKDSMTKSQAT
jgi:hypothetical protein